MKTDQTISKDVNIKADRLYWSIRENKQNISELDFTDPDSTEVILRLLNDSIDYFIDLPPEARTEEFARKFAAGKLQATDAIGSEKMLFPTYDGDLGLVIHDISAPIDYFDHDLDIPTWLRVDADCRIVLDNILLIMRTMNHQLSSFSMSSLSGFVRGIITATTANAVLEFFDKKNVGYFHFGQSLKELSALVKQELDEELGKCGISVYSYSIRKLEISDEVTSMLRKEYFSVRSQSIRAEAEKRWADLSLNELERKAEIISKYDLPSDVLTEMEKDKAMERYLKKVNNRLEKVIYDDERPEDAEGPSFKAIEQKLPEEPEKPKNFISHLITCAILTVISVVLAIAVSPYIWIAAGVFLIGAAWFAFKLRNFRSKKEEYEKLMRIYEQDMKRYEDAQDEI